MFFKSLKSSSYVVLLSSFHLILLRIYFFDFSKTLKRL